MYVGIVLIFYFFFFISKSKSLILMKNRGDCPVMFLEFFFKFWLWKTIFESIARLRYHSMI